MVSLHLPTPRTPVLSRPRAHRVSAVTERNLSWVGSTGGYVWLLLASFAEPMLYLVSFGWGVGALVGNVDYDGSSVSYLHFVAPALIATSVMNGSLAETTINFFAKLRYWRYYDAVVCTPVTPIEIVFGELIWGIVRSAMYSIVFLAGMSLVGLTTPLRALLAFPAALLLGASFGALGLAFSTFMRSWQDFEYSGVVQFAMFLLSGTFVPISVYPDWLQAVVRCTPLYQGSELLRGIAIGSLGEDLLGPVAYLLVLTGTMLAIACIGLTRRLTR